MKRRIASFFLAFMMMLSLLPSTALAIEPDDSEIPEQEEKSGKEVSTPEDEPSELPTVTDETPEEPDDSVNAGKAWIGETEYASLAEAVEEAEDGDTIQLDAGEYTLYEPNGNHTTGIKKSLTFVGKGPKETTWRIGPETPNPAYYVSEFNADYSFAGSSVTFQNMTLRSITDQVAGGEYVYKESNYLGFAHTVHTTVENCVVVGRTTYWGNETATFKDTTFYSGGSDYVMWVGASTADCEPVWSYENCTFYVSGGKVLNLYKHAAHGVKPLTVNYSNCAVYESEQVL